MTIKINGKSKGLKARLLIPFALVAALVISAGPVHSATMNDYCITPPFLQATIPPLVMLVMSKDHKDFYKAYDDYSDLDGDGLLDTTYKHSITYYGYFDSTKCYSYSGGVFTPQTLDTANTGAPATCSGQWSGNFLNWATMSRIDTLRKVLYGGTRSTDSTTSTILERSFLPQDSHSWVKVYTPGTGDASKPSISQLTPYSLTSISLCNTTVSDVNETSSFAKPPLARVASGEWYRWASAERWQCAFKLEKNSAYDNLRPASGTVTPYNLNVRVEACVTGKIGSEKCKKYGTSTYYKPVGLLQDFGEGNKIYFGLLSGSWSKHIQGGVLRKNVTTITDEINQSTGQFLYKTDSAVKGIIYTQDNLRLRRYKYISTYTNDNPGAYNDDSGADGCPWGKNAQYLLDNPAKCTNWGNPMAEMFLETMRYFAGKSKNNSFDDGDSIGLSTATWYDPYVESGTNALCRDSSGNKIACPYCAKPIALVVSDTSTSFDADQLGGASDFSGLTVATQTNAVGANEGISGNIFAGSNGTTTDNVCSEKPFTSLSALRGICPTEPSRQGSYNIAGLAYWANLNDLRSGTTGKQTLTTYAVALSPQLPEIKVSVGGGAVKLIPACHNTTNDTMCTLVQFRVVTQTATSGLFYVNWEDSEQGGDYDMDADGYLRYDVSGSTITLKAEVFGHSAGTSILEFGFTVSGTNSDGAKWLAKNCQNQTYCDGNTAKWFSCSVTNDTSPETNSNCYENSVDQKQTWSQFMATRTWLSGSRALTPSGTAAQMLKDPLWYAAKYGGFKDADSNNLPYTDSTCLTSSQDARCKEWVTYPKQTPDNYFYVTNPLKLETELSKALNQILAGVSSGTAVSMLTSSEGSGSNLLQAVFYPKRSFIDPTTSLESSVAWTSELQDFWYYLDPLLGSSSIREDTNKDKILNLTDDYRIAFVLDSSDNTKVYKYDNSGTFQGQVSFEDMDTSLWRAGYELWKRDWSTRTIKTNLNTATPGTSGTPASFNTDTANVSNTTLQIYLQVSGADAATKTADATNIIKYVMGKDFNYCSNALSTECAKNSDCGTGTCVLQRKRAFSIDLDKNGTIDADTETKVWKLGDIISSTPRVQSSIRLNTYHLAPPLGYNDQTYSSFIASTNYKDRGTAYAGGNDGMLHAFRLGNLKELAYTGNIASLVDTSNSLGKEEWAFIPRNALPYLKYISSSDYAHLYYVDLPPTLVDASLGTAGNIRTVSDWKTVLVGGMNLGGASKQHLTADTCDAATDCVFTPWAATSGNKDVGLSSYFALDITNVTMSDPTNFSFLWEFWNADLGFSTTGPAIVRVGNASYNGTWYAVFASGPTGPIDTSSHQFKGLTKQTLKIFIVNLKTGALERTIDTGISNAFGGSLHNAALDPDRWNPISSGFYQDDVVYIGYSQCTGTISTDGICSAWDGGVIRLITKETTHGSWTWNTVISGIGGPVTTVVTKLQDRPNKKLWLYFGTGRYYYKTSSSMDDANGTRRIFGIQEPCYSPALKPTRLNAFDSECTADDGLVAFTSLANQTTYSGTCSGGTVPNCSNTVSCQTGFDCKVALEATKKGWYIDLPCSAGATGTVCTGAGTSPAGYYAERVITDPVASYNGAVFFTTFSPTMDVCGSSGNTYIWAVGYNSGTSASVSALVGTALIQVSTGSISEQQLSTAFTQSGQRKTTAIKGMPPTGGGLSVSVPPRPMMKFMHIKEQ
jgi:type IV pilus assembly protein PilY1